MHQLLELFDNDINNLPIYIINMKEQKNRLNNTLNELKKIRDTSLKNVHIIHGIDPGFAEKHMHKFFTYKVYKNINNPTNTNFIPTWSAGACALSHLNTWIRILESGKEIAIIVEDDIKIKDPNVAKFFITEAYKNAKTKSDSVWFFNGKIKDLCPYYNNYNYYYYYHQSSNLYYDPYYLTKRFKSFDLNSDTFHSLFSKFDCLIKSHFYMVTRSALLKMVEYFYPIEYQIDIHLSNILRNRCQLTIMNTNYDCHIYQDVEKFPSTVQYFYFNNYKTLWICFNKKLPIENCKLIFEFIKKKNFYE